MFPKKDWPHAFNNQLSWGLVPLLFIVWYIFPQTNFVFATSMLAIIAIGIIETIFYEKKLSTISRFISVFLHLLLLIPFFVSERLITNILNPITKEKTSNNNNNNNNNESKKKVKIDTDKNKYFYNNNFYTLTQFNIWSFILLIVGNLIIHLLPYWPYYMARCQMMIYLNSIVIGIWLYNFVN